MAILSGGEIVRACREIQSEWDEPFIEIPAPELGEGATIRGGMMNPAERDRWDVLYGRYLRQLDDSNGDDAGDEPGAELKRLAHVRPTDSIRATFMFLTARDGEGQPAFQNETQLQVLSTTLGPKWEAVLQRYWNDVYEFCGLSDKAVEEAGKNSNGEPT